MEDMVKSWESPADIIISPVPNTEEEVQFPFSSLQHFWQGWHKPKRDNKIGGMLNFKKKNPLWINSFDNLTSIIIRLCSSSGRLIKLNNVWVKESRVLLSGWRSIAHIIRGRSSCRDNTNQVEWQLIRQKDLQIPQGCWRIFWKPLKQHFEKGLKKKSSWKPKIYWDSCSFFEDF